MNLIFYFLQPASSTCCVCNGYYAPSFGEPLCGTCHAFLFPVAAEEKRSTDLSDNDEDSGNDEPPYKEAAANPPARAPVYRNEQGPQVDSDEDIIVPPDDVQLQQPAPQPLIPVASTSRSNDRIAIYENAFLNDRPEPQPPRNLRQYLNALTEGTHEANQNPLRQPIIVNDINNEVAAAVVAAAAAVAEATAAGTGAGVTIKPGTISSLPVEVLLVIFSYLDDISLCHVGEVCKQWKKILEVHTPQSLWQRATRTRWPLYHQITNTTNWFKVNNFYVLFDRCDSSLNNLAI